MEYIIIYVIGVVISLFSLHKWKKELNIDNYDNQKDNHDDWDSNAQAYAAWSIGWPILIWLVGGIMLWKVLLILSKLIQDKVEKPMGPYIKRIKIGDLTVKFVFRHYWENEKDLPIWERRNNFRRKELGFWFQKSLAVGTKKKGKEAFSESNLVPSYMLGMNLIYAKCWITIDRNVLHIKID